MKIRLLLLLQCLAVWLISWGQEPRFIQHDIGDINQKMTITSMVQDHGCMIWLGTEKGLARFDGIAWHNVAMPDPPKGINADSAAKFRHVTSIAEDSRHRLWVGTASGFIFYLDSLRSLKEFFLEEGFPIKPIKSIVEDRYGQIWFATYGEGTHVYDGNRLYNFNTDDNLSSDDVYAMIATPDGKVWMGTDNGISICSFQDEKKTVEVLDLANGLPDEIITSLTCDSKGNVYIGTYENGIVKFDPVTKKMVKPFTIPGLDEVTAIELFDDREIWFGTRTSGIWSYTPGQGSPRRILNHTLEKAKNVTDILADVEGNIWITWHEGGLVSGFRPFESQTYSIGEIQALQMDEQDQLWIGTTNGLYKQDYRTSGSHNAERVSTLNPFNVTSLLEDPFGNIWIGTKGQGLYIYDIIKNKIISIGSVVRDGDAGIICLALSHERIWMSTFSGIFSYPADHNILLDRKHDFQLLQDPWNSSSNYTYHIFVDSKDRIWYATDGEGVYCNDNGKFIHHTGTDSVSLAKVYSVCEDHRGHIWFNSYNTGLVEYDGVSYTLLDFKDGLRNPITSSILSSGTGDLIIVHAKGVDVMEPERRHFMYYGEEIGAKEIEPLENAISIDQYQNIYIGCRDRIITYLNTNNKLSIHPRTKFRKILVFENEIDFRHIHQFSSAQNFFTFDYIGLWYTSPSSVKYQYKLEPYDRGWTDSRDNRASYSHLKPGDYTFYVKASENEEFLDEPIEFYSFTIRKPFWRKSWFLIVAGLTGVSLLYWLIKSREKRSEKQALVKKGMVESQLSTLKAQINPHFLFNSFNTLITIIDENATRPKVAIEYVEKLSDFYRSILQYREQESITLEEEFEVVRNFGYLLEKRYGDFLRLHLAKPSGDAWIFPLTLQILVENAVKHNIISEKHPLDVFITVDPDAYVTVRNNVQLKSKAEPSTQFGLQSIVKQYQLITDRKVMIHQDSKIFEVRIPFLKRSDS